MVVKDLFLNINKGDFLCLTTVEKLYVYVLEDYLENVVFF